MLYNFIEDSHLIVGNVCVSEGKKCLFFGNFGVLCFRETPVLRFALLPYYRLIVSKTENTSVDIGHIGPFETKNTNCEKLLRIKLDSGIKFQ